jgi:hypothetical protein
MTNKRTVETMIAHNVNKGIRADRSAINNSRNARAAHLALWEEYRAAQETACAYVPGSLVRRASGAHVEPVHPCASAPHGGSTACVYRLREIVVAPWRHEGWRYRYSLYGSIATPRGCV